MAAPVVNETRVKVEFASSTELAITAGTRVAGDGLIVGCWTQVEKTLSAPAGYTLLATCKRSASIQCAYYGRIATNTSADNFKTTWTTATNRFGEMIRITGSPAEVAKWLVGETNNGSSTTIAVKKLTTTSAENRMMLLWNTAEERTPSKVEPEGWGSKKGSLVPTYDKEKVAAGEEVEAKLTITTNPWVSVMLAIPPTVEETVFTETASGTIEVTGSFTETLEATEAIEGTVTVTGSGSETGESSETAEGTRAPTGSFSESLEITEAISGTIEFTGTFSELVEFLEEAAGSMLLIGTKSEVFENEESGKHLTYVLMPLGTRGHHVIQEPDAEEELPKLIFRILNFFRRKT
ncbi:MAG TPA: hypothetical protein VFT74_02795 [Isosphaeraceae bacterium]|nr:hypothetical protein [Isosphaeraceae bacterium]